MQICGNYFFFGAPQKGVHFLFNTAVCLLRTPCEVIHASVKFIYTNPRKYLFWRIRKTAKCVPCTEKFLQNELSPDGILENWNIQCEKHFIGGQANFWRPQMGVFRFRKIRKFLRCADRPPLFITDFLSFNFSSSPLSSAVCPTLCLSPSHSIFPPPPLPFPV